MTLPPELVDEILVYLQHDKRALRNCSLVAQSWTYLSQKRLFISINLTPEIHKARQEFASPTSAEVLQHVRTLTCLRIRSFGVLHSDYFRSLHRLQNLALRDIPRIESNTPNLFIAFQDTLSSLVLYHVYLTWSTFVALVDYFPNLRELDFSESTFEPDQFPVSPPSRPPRGKLRLSTLLASDFGTLCQGIAGLEPEYDQLEIIDIFEQTHSNVQRIIWACKKTLTYLRVDVYHCK